MYLYMCDCVLLPSTPPHTHASTQVTTSRFDALLGGIDSLKQVCARFLQNKKQCSLIKYSSYKHEIDEDTLNDTLRAGATLTSALQLLYRFQQQGTSFINLADMQKALTAEKKRVVAFISHPDCQLFKGIEVSECVSVTRYVFFCIYIYM
jgi:hypothetical protein